MITSSSHHFAKDLLTTPRKKSTCPSSGRAAPREKSTSPPLCPCLPLAGLGPQLGDTSIPTIGEHVPARKSCRDRSPASPNRQRGSYRAYTTPGGSWRRPSSARWVLAETLLSQVGPGGDPPQPGNFRANACEARTGGAGLACDPLQRDIRLGLVVREAEVQRVQFEHGTRADLAPHEPPGGCGAWDAKRGLRVGTPSLLGWTGWAARCDQAGWAAGQLWPGTCTLANL
eukprot:gene8094-biopygen13638